MPETTRQLAAIMFTDIVGYTALMGDNTDKALELVRISKEIQKPLVEKHNGKWLKEMGDGAMAQFSTALDAVNCAIEIQKSARAELDAKLRIGIHLGDLTVEENDVHGDGVNVASRLESIADPGGIYVSESIEKAIQGQTDIKAKYLGEVKLKNVAYGLRTYALQGVGLPVPEVKDEKHLSGRFNAELQRRGVIRASAVYIILSLLLLLLVPYARSLVDLPEWTKTALITVLLIGFPLAIYLAWNYERSPEGFVRTSSQQSWQNPYSTSQRKPLTGNFIIGGLVLVITVMYLYPRSFTDNSPGSPSVASTTAPKDNSIAVLYFDNISSDPEQDYFSDGITEEITSHLSVINGLRVTSRTSVIPYKGQAINIREIARQLNVATILEGSVRKSGNKLRITAQLIDARTDEHIWTEVYDRDLADIFKIQSEIAQAIADKFKIVITPEAYKKLTKPPTTNIKAYELYLKARSLSWGAGFGIGTHFGGAVNTASLLKEAIALDPDYVQPYVLLSTLYLGFSFGSARLENIGSYDSAVLLAKEAIIIDPTSADGYIALANTQNFENSLKWLYKAVELDSLMGLIGLAKAYRNKGELPKAIQCYSEAVKYGPNSYEPYLGKAKIYSSMAQIDSMNKYLALSNKMAPNTREIYGARMSWKVFNGKIDGTMELAKKYYGEDTLNFNKEMGIVYLMARNWKKAESYYLKTGYRDMDWGLVLINTGRRDSGMLVLKNSLAYRGPNGWPGDLSRINAVLGNKELAIADFEKLVGSGWHDIGWIRNDPFWDELREEPKFKKIAEAVERKNDEMLNQIEEYQNRKFTLAF